jgi:hypothetical protein
LFEEMRFGIELVVTREYRYVGLAEAGSTISAAVMSLQPLSSQLPYALS